MFWFSLHNIALALADRMLFEYSWKVYDNQPTQVNTLCGYSQAD